ncbi:SAM-dependent methyltransferase [Mycobacterium rufum]|uniref:S-adenosyl-L-methionine-dependent methyltransferase n=1 Tax=Mycolicibacterium rufum TaxID=318424 RepID=A0A9X2XTQ3_9MYCO|nr:methyltransferase [Mycolicibacterium rufum]MCV7069707.1 SAM-dependent methyltransferase [Mycolicibacterium rufum]
MLGAALVTGEAVARTAVLVAAIRADESRRDRPLFEDPFAARLAGEAGRKMLARMVAEAGERSTAQIVVRTRFWDEALLRATQTVRQVVILAAGLDARAYRLAWPPGTTVIEVDQPAVIAAKDGVLAGEQPRCHRVSLGADLAGDWSAALTDAGLDPSAPTAWLIEGLLQYLDGDAVHRLFARVHALSAPGSVLLYDVVSAALLTAPEMTGLLASMEAQGSPWLFGIDAPGELAESLGWTATVTDVAEPGAAFGRWPDAATGGGFFVEAHKGPNGQR